MNQEDKSIIYYSSGILTMYAWVCVCVVFSDDKLCQWCHWPIYWPKAWTEQNHHEAYTSVKMRLPTWWSMEVWREFTAHNMSQPHHAYWTIFSHLCVYHTVYVQKFLARLVHSLQFSSSPLSPSGVIQKNTHTHTDTFARARVSSMFTEGGWKRLLLWLEEMCVGGGQ